MCVRVCDYMVSGFLGPLKPHVRKGPQMQAHSKSEVIGEGVTASGNETHLKLQLNNIN